MKQPKIIEKLFGIVLYTWDNENFQIDIDFPNGESFCIGSWKSYDKAVRNFYLKIIEQIKYHHSQLPNKVKNLINLAVNPAAYIGEVENSVKISLKLLGYNLC